MRESLANERYQINPSYRSKPEEVKTSLFCCVIAPFGTNLNPIRLLLIERGIDNYILYKLPFSGMSIAKDVENDISKSDLVIAVLDSKSSNCNTYYELGYARGLRKRILILVSPGLELPAVLMDTFFIRANCMHASRALVHANLILRCENWMWTNQTLI
jgi:hypothetical protein